MSREHETETFQKLAARAERLGNIGVRQREFLHELHGLAERNIRDVVEGRMPLVRPSFRRPR